MGCGVWSVEQVFVMKGGASYCFVTCGAIANVQNLVRLQIGASPKLGLLDGPVEQFRTRLLGVAVLGAHKEVKVLREAHHRQCALH